MSIALFSITNLLWAIHNILPDEAKTPLFAVIGVVTIVCLIAVFRDD